MSLKVYYKGKPYFADLTVRESLFSELRQSNPQLAVRIISDNGDKVVEIGKLKTEAEEKYL